MRSLPQLLLLLLLCGSTHARTRTVLSNHDQGQNKGWQNPTNWSPTGVPQSGDTVMVPAGKTISVKGSVYAATAASITIYVYGALDFDPSGKLNLNSLGVVQLFTSASKITTNGTSSEQIVIGGGVKYNGQNDGTITGPAFSSNVSPNSSPSRPGTGFIIGILPLKLTAFKGVETGRKVRISWTTEGETGIEGFELQRSSNGWVWKTINTIASKNRCTCLTTYTYEDLFPQPGLNYYRLRSRHLDGAAELSTQVVVKVATLTGKDVVLHFNAAGTQLQLNLNPSSFTFPVQVQLITAMGQVFQKQVASSKAVLEVSTFPKGLVVLTIEDQLGRRSVVKGLKE